MALAYLLAALSGSGIATAYVLPWAMVPDVVEVDQAQTGQRREGSYYAFASFFQKLATGAALWAMGQALAVDRLHHARRRAARAACSRPQAVSAIRLFAGPVPAVLLLLAVLCAWRYPITRESHQALLEELAGTGRGTVVEVPASGMACPSGRCAS